MLGSSPRLCLGPESKQALRFRTTVVSHSVYLRRRDKRRCLDSAIHEHLDTDLHVHSVHTQGPIYYPFLRRRSVARSRLQAHRLRLKLPLLFKLVNTDVGTRRIMGTTGPPPCQFCGVLEFSAPEDQVRETKHTGCTIVEVDQTCTHFLYPRLALLI